MLKHRLITEIKAVHILTEGSIAIFPTAPSILAPITILILAAGCPNQLAWMRSQEQLWLQNPLFWSASGNLSKQAGWRAMAVKRLLTCDRHMQALGQDMHSHNNTCLYLQGDGLVDFRTSHPVAHVHVKVTARGHRNSEAFLIAQKEMQAHARNCSFGGIRTQGHHQVGSHKLGLRYSVLQAQQQVCSVTRSFGNGNEKQGHKHMKFQENGHAKPLRERQNMQQRPDLLVQHQQQVATQRPLPKRLLPLPITRRNLSTTTMPPSFRRSIAIADSVKLTDLEFKIFTILKASLVHYNLKTQLRVVGGWVRDKLLGKQCGDIDIALDDMLGRTFCQKLWNYCRLIGMEPNGFGVVKSKPTRARHLEVAKMVILGVAIDFVNLRPPNYAESSSKSFTMEDFGTVAEDAYGRDLTINSLFYNINTGKIEDPTGRGLSDLRAGIIATPSPAKETFKDDPLRALRALRFVSALGYELHPYAKDAIDADVRFSLDAKISRERIGGEVERIFRCCQPLRAMELLVETNLFPVVFRPPPELRIILPEGIERTCLHALGVTIDVLNHFGSSKLSGEHRKSLYLAAFLSPLRTLVYEGKNKLVPISTAIIKESLKLRSLDAAMVATLHETAGNYTSIQKLILKLHAMDQWEGDVIDSEAEMQTSYSGMKYEIVKLLEKARGLWRSSLLLGVVLEDFQVEVPSEKRKEELRRKLNLCIFVEEAIVKLGFEEIRGPYPFLERKRISENG